MPARRRWEDMSTGGRILTVLVGAVQVSLAISAWADLARRPAQQVRGSKAAWAGIIAVNFIGPLLYFARGRRATTVAVG